MLLLGFHKSIYGIRIIQGIRMDMVLKIIDFHTHYPSGKNPLKRLIKACEEASVEKICLHSLGRFGEREDENTLVEKAFKEYPDLIKGFGFVHLGVDDPNVIDDLYSRGFTGIKVFKPMKPYDSEDFFPYYSKAEEYRMPILFHTGAVARDPVDKEIKATSWYMRPICLDKIARCFPKLILIGAHLGHPWCDEATLVMHHNPNVYFDICGGHTFWVALALKRRLRYDADPYRLLYGTDASPENFLKIRHFWEVLLPQLGFNREEVKAIFHDNAERIFKSVSH